MSNPDVIVIGSGLTGLIAAATLKVQGQKVCVLEGREVLGGCLRQIEVRGRKLPSGIHFLPADATTTIAVERLSKLVNLDLQFSEQTAEPVTFEAGELKSFIGFGEASGAAVDEFSKLNVSRRLLVNKAPDDWIEALLNFLTSEERLPLSEVTGIEVENGHVQRVQINGAKTLSSAKVIYTGSIVALDKLIPGEGLHTKTRSRLVKAKGLTAVSLHFAHAATQTQNGGYHFLAGAGAESDPLVGGFLPPQSDGTQNSTWMALLPDEKSDEESIGHSLRHMKKQIKRAYPTAFDNLIAEKIVVSSDSHGTTHLKLKDPGCFAEIDNLFIGTARTATVAGVGAALRRGFQAADWALPPSRITVDPPSPVCYSPDAF